MIGYTQQVGPAICCAIGQSATMVSVLWGFLVWKGSSCPDRA